MFNFLFYKLLIFILNLEVIKKARFFWFFTVNYIKIFIINILYFMYNWTRSIIWKIIFLILKMILNESIQQIIQIIYHILFRICLFFNLVKIIIFILIIIFYILNLLFFILNIRNIIIAFFLLYYYIWIIINLNFFIFLFNFYFYLMNYTFIFFLIYFILYKNKTWKQRIIGLWIMSSLLITLYSIKLLFIRFIIFIHCFSLLFYKELLCMWSYLCSASRSDMLFNFFPIFTIQVQSFNKSHMFIILPSTLIIIWRIKCWLNYLYFILLIFIIFIYFLFWFALL